MDGTQAVYRLVVAVLLIAGGLLASPGMVKAQTGRVQSDWRTDWNRTSIDLNELEANVARDAIPSIDSPRFVTVDEAEEWIGDGEPVISLTIKEETRAYPLQVLIWHEIVNDRIADVPIAVTFCPLCYSTLVFDRRIGDNEFEFGVSGMLRHSDLVMFDRQTHSLFQQITGEAIVGTLNGSRLEQIPAQIVSFKEFAEAHPQAMVLSRDTGFDRKYGQNPYPGYDDVDERPWAFRGEHDERLAPMEKVIGVELNGSARAWPHGETRKAGVIHDTMDGRDIVIFHTQRGARTALGGEQIRRARIVGSTGVFDRNVDGQILTFERQRNGFRDEETRSIWDVTGRAVEGPLEGRQLTLIPYADLFSFAWFVLYPDTSVYSD